MAAPASGKKIIASERTRADSFLQRVEDRAVPDIDAVLRSDRQQHQKEEADGEWPGEAVALAAPEARGRRPEAALQRALALFLLAGFGLRIVYVI